MMVRDIQPLISGNTDFNGKLKTIESDTFWQIDPSFKVDQKGRFFSLSIVDQSADSDHYSVVPSCTLKGFWTIF